VTVKNWKKGIVEGKRLVMAHGGYALTVPGEGDEPEEVNGKWICIAERRDDGSLASVRNIWNVDAPPEGAPEMYPLNATGPAAAEETPCHATPTALDQAFRDDLVAGNVAAIAASHAEDAIRMAPGRPALEGRQAISDYTQSFMETFSDRELELTGIDEQVDGNVGYTWGSFRYTYTPSSGDDQVQDEGKYVSVATQDANGCWQTQWVLWNSNTPWTTE
jgi:ketosteroid isomerase-like protein